ncbi:hypothetical protein NVS47_16190 [Dehalobacterium formicoaceticum]|uniref:Uncharacterized protein n=1 Tax=Dehalobacterium formicoaceticum TaxID=51515 RepID=A0ABT1YAA3_9FIRM|nr:hypothetical protein [Dehalobacterium formicoaceticum]MCR6547030.1 hypothetical protein [Dehalobacterium formicoaceticum]
MVVLKPRLSTYLDSQEHKGVLHLLEIEDSMCVKLRFTQAIGISLKNGILISGQTAD